MNKIVLFLLFSYHTICFAQQSETVEAFRALNTTEARFVFLADSTINKMDYATFEAILPIIEAKKDGKSTFYWHYKNQQFLVRFGKSNDEFPISITKMSEIAQKIGYKEGVIIAQFKTAMCNFGGRKISEQDIYAAYLNCFEQMKSIGFEKFKYYNPEWTFYEIGRNFYELGDYEKALECLLVAEKESKPQYHFYTLSMNLIETIYANKKDYPKAIAYAQKIYDANLIRTDKEWLYDFWKGLALLDIADYLLEMGKINESEVYANKGHELAKIKEDFTQPYKIMAEFEALQVAIKVKLYLGKIKEAAALLKRAEFLKPRLGLGMDAHYFKPLKFYQNYTKFYEAKKDYVNAFRYMKLANELQDSLNRRNDKRKLWQTELRVKTDNYKAEIITAEAESILQQNLRNIAILMLFSFVGISFFVYRRIKNDNKTIEKQKTQLESSLAEKDTLLKEIHHRVKNNLQIIAGLLEKQAMNTDDERTRKLMREGQDRVYSMALVHQNLYQSENLHYIDIKPYLEMLGKNIQQSHGLMQQKITLHLDVGNSTIDIDTAIPLGLILNELITNCYKYAFENREEGNIYISFHQKNEQFDLSVEDDGNGLPEHFDIQKSNSLGLNLVLGLVRQLDGKFHFDANQNGTCFYISK